MDAAQRLEEVKIFSGLPLCLRGKQFDCLCRRLGFDPWVGKILWRRKWLPTPGFLPVNSNTWGSLAGYGPRVAKESGTT